MYIATEFTPDVWLDTVHHTIAGVKALPRPFVVPLQGQPAASTAPKTQEAVLSVTPATCEKADVPRR